MDSQISPTELLDKMTDFMAYAEATHSHFEECRAQIQQQFQEIQDSIRELRELTANDMGISRLRQAMRDVLTEGEAHVKALKQTGQEQLQELQANNDQILRLAKKSFDRLDKASNFVVKNIAESISTVRIGDFKRLTDESREHIETVSVTTIKRLREMVNWFHWKNLALAGAITIIVTLTLGLYLNDELPWEMHEKVAMQRNAGQALMNAWPSLTQAERQRIMDHAKKAII